METTTNEFIEVVKRRRSIRRFKPDPIPEGSVETILETARWAMSGANGQPWEFVVVSDKETIVKIAEINIELSRKRLCVIEDTRKEELRHPMFRRFNPKLPGWKDAPVLIAVCGDLRTYQATVLATHFYQGEGGFGATYLKNMANPTQLICLTAASLGIGSQWVSVNFGWERPVKTLLDLPEELVIHTLVPLGYPTYDPIPSYRREFSEIVHYGKYDHSKYRTDEDIQEFLGLLREHTNPNYAVDK